MDSRRSATWLRDQRAKKDVLGGTLIGLGQIACGLTIVVIWYGAAWGCFSPSGKPLACCTVVGSGLEVRRRFQTILEWDR